MGKSIIPKKRARDIRRELLHEPVLTPEEKKIFEEGIRLFNHRRFWEAHECWEELWRQRPEESRIFFQGIIQAAAGFHRIVEHPKKRGAVNNLTKALEKLDLFPGRFLGLDVDILRASIHNALSILDRESIGDTMGSVPLPTLQLFP